MYQLNVLHVCKDLRQFLVVVDSFLCVLCLIACLFVTCLLPFQLVVVNKVWSPLFILCYYTTTSCEHFLLLFLSLPSSPSCFHLSSPQLVSEQPAHHSQQIVDFLREAKEMTKFDHPRIVKLLCVCTVWVNLLLRNMVITWQSHDWVITQPMSNAI